MYKIINFKYRELALSGIAAVLIVGLFINGFFDNSSSFKEAEIIEYMNYEPREDLCKAGCNLGVKLKVPAYVFLKDSIIRKYGTEFYEALDASAKHLQKK